MTDETLRCDTCGHDVALHRSTGCLWRLGACPCPYDLRGNRMHDAKVTPKTSSSTRLTHKEWLAWCCYVGGMTRAQIAQSLRLTENTVNDRLKVARRKTGARDAIEAGKMNPDHG